MKKVILSLAIIGVIGAIQAQDALQVEPVYASTNEMEVSNAVEALSALPNSNDLLDDATYKESDLDENIEYIEEVQSPNTPREVRDSQLMASLYDVTESYIFDGRNDAFQMMFVTDKGTIMASYNWKGEVLSSEEKYRNVSIPKSMRNAILKNHEGWRVLRTSFEVSYEKGRKATKVYTVQITDGKKKKKVSMDAEGMVI